MAAEKEPLAVAAREGEPLVAGGVDLLDGAGGRDLRPQPLPGAVPRLRPRDPLRAVLVARQFPQLAQLRDGAGRIEHGAIVIGQKPAA